jgi:hypothetical protein
VIRPGLIFNEDDHAYIFEGRRYTSITQAMKNAGMTAQWLSKSHKDAAEMKAMKGSNVHLACHYHDTVGLDFDSLTQDVVPYVQGYVLFREQVPFTVISSEEPMISVDWGYAGTPDKVIMIDGAYAVLELKTTAAIERSVDVQMAAQAQLVMDSHEFVGIPKVEIEKRMAVYLKDDGSYVLYAPRKTQQEDFAVFVSALNVSNWKDGGK